MSKTYFDSINKIWRGSKLPTIYNSNVSMGYLVLNILQNSPDTITQISDDSGIELTCRQMYQKAINIASYLQRIDCKQGEIVGFSALNSENLAATVFACLTLGLPINCLSPVLFEKDIIRNYSQTKPKLIFCDADIVEKIKKVVEVLPTSSQIFTVDRKVDGFTCIGDIADHNDNDTETFIFPQLDPDTLAFILATSGTSNYPKQVCKSHKQLIEEANEQWKFKLSSTEIWFGFTGIDWITGISTLFLGTLFGAKRIITARKFDPDLMLEIIAKYNVTTAIVVSRLMAALTDCKSNSLTSMRVLIVGGTAASKELCLRSKLLFPNCEICPAYGCSEAGTLTLNLTNRKLDSVGQIYGNVEMKILNGDSDSLGVDEIGEIVYKTPVIFSGYFQDEVKTKEAIRDGWVFSGDLGYFDKEGYLFITDRKTDIMKCDVNISPSELESIISGIAGVIAVCVVGAITKYSGNDVVYAFVIKRPDSDVNGKLIEDYVSARVEDAKKIRGGVHFVESFPLSNNGKIQRFEIRRWAQEKYNDSVAKGFQFSCIACSERCVGYKDIRIWNVKQLGWL